MTVFSIRSKILCATSNFSVMLRKLIARCVDSDGIYFGLNIIEKSETCTNYRKSIYSCVQMHIVLQPFCVFLCIFVCQKYEAHLIWYNFIDIHTLLSSIYTLFDIIVSIITMLLMIMTDDDEASVGHCFKKMFEAVY